MQIRVRESLLSYRIFIEKFIHFLFKNSYWLTQKVEDCLFNSVDDLTFEIHADIFVILIGLNLFNLFKIKVINLFWNYFHFLCNPLKGKFLLHAIKLLRVCKAIFICFLYIFRRFLNFFILFERKWTLHVFSQCDNHF